MLTRNQEKAATSWNRHMLGTESLWYFGKEKSRAIAFDAQQYFQVGPTDEATGLVFVPLKTVLDLGSSLLANGFTQSNDDDDDDDASAQAPPKVSNWTDEYLLDQIPRDWTLSDASKEQKPKIRVRLQNGGYDDLHIKVDPYRNTSDSWTAHVRKILGLGSGKSFKPTRHCDMPLDKPLLIQPLDKRQGLIRSRFDRTVSEFLSILIQEANETNIKNKMTPGSDDGKWELRLYDHKFDQQQKPPGYNLMSVDPFEFFVTWIHEDDWHSYMMMLAKTETYPIRKFISFKDRDTCNTLNNLMLKVGERDLKIQGGLSLDERKKYGLNLQQKEDDEATMAEFNRRKISKALKDKRLQGLGSQVKTYNFLHGQTAIDITLGQAKMAAAAGKRASQLTQAAVMGGVSASDIATTLEWEKQRMSSGFFSSEWLHLAAFSWGGFLPADQKSGFSTSQNLENLIFGTSETNSLMTRYEMAWQDFYRREQKLHDKLGPLLQENPRSPQGRLEIRCNDFSQPIRYDRYTPGNQYNFDYFTMDEKLVKEVRDASDKILSSDNPKLMLDVYNSLGDTTKRLNQDHRTAGQAASQAEMLLLAHDFPAVVYSLEYTIKNEFISVLLDDQACASYMFYPFHRSLYHQAEAVLDALVWKAIKEKADALVDDAIEKLASQPAGIPPWRKKVIRAETKANRLDHNYAHHKFKFLNGDRPEEIEPEQEGLSLKKQPVFTILKYSRLFNAPYGTGSYGHIIGLIAESDRHKEGVTACGLGIRVTGTSINLEVIPTSSSYM
ncbi:uncharacterized protein JN550_012903 [Neoarthrinium moseri]|uniref:uncharacterized protein n=1 Tax=Neoarthrinium moseri TaxID=1658444 RepID=UPI001FDB6ECB|nr:uncharacterized protein JN550_012903 [Neoarthrinium moseri]KAI1858010.1 hypothetical protein JN550_012903 [Neoarthrinium moseri]